jgi:hypothetical protein
MNRYEVEVTTNGIIFRPNFMEAGQFVLMLKEIPHRQLDLINPLLSLRQGTRLKISIKTGNI